MYLGVLRRAAVKIGKSAVMRKKAVYLPHCVCHSQFERAGSHLSY